MSNVKPVEEYTFDELVAHLHDYHGLNAEDQAEDEEFNGTDPAVIEHIRNMTRDEAMERLPYHYFMGTNTPRDSREALASAHITHDQQHADNPGGYGAVHFHPGAFREEI